MLAKQARFFRTRENRTAIWLQEFHGEIFTVKTVVQICLQQLVSDLLRVASSNTWCRPSRSIFSRPRESQCDLASNLSIQGPQASIGSFA